MTSSDLVGIAVLVVLGPAMVLYLVWLVRIRPRRHARLQLARAEQAGRALGLATVEEGLARGVRDGRTVEVSYGVSATPAARGGRPITTCRVALSAPFPVPFAVVTPRRYAAGATQRWARDVWIGGPDARALELAASLAPVVEAHARAMDDTLVLELDRATCSVILEGIVLDPARLERALALAGQLASALPR